MGLTNAVGVGCSLRRPGAGRRRSQAIGSPYSKRCVRGRHLVEEHVWHKASTAACLRRVLVSAPNRDDFVVVKHDPHLQHRVVTKHDVVMSVRVEAEEALEHANKSICEVTGVLGQLTLPMGRRGGGVVGVGRQGLTARAHMFLPGSSFAPPGTTFHVIVRVVPRDNGAIVGLVT